MVVATVELSDIELEVIGEMQCPGCTCGCAPANECESFKPDREFGFRCDAHSGGTPITGMGWIYLGLPKGFNRVGAFRAKGDNDRSNNIRLWIHPNAPFFDNLSVPVWAMEKDGYLYVRTYLPRINLTFVDVIKGGTMELVPGAENVAEFIDEID